MTCLHKKCRLPCDQEIRTGGGHVTYYLRVLQITVPNVEGHVTSREFWKRLVLKLENAM